jgi:hypothetical protein
MTPRLLDFVDPFSGLTAIMNDLENWELFAHAIPSCVPLASYYPWQVRSYSELRALESALIFIPANRLLVWFDGPKETVRLEGIGCTVDECLSSAVVQRELRLARSLEASPADLLPALLVLCRYAGEHPREHPHHVNRPGEPVPAVDDRSRDDYERLAQTVANVARVRVKPDRPSEGTGGRLTSALLNYFFVPADLSSAVTRWRQMTEGIEWLESVLAPRWAAAARMLSDGIPSGGGIRAVATPWSSEFDHLRRISRRPRHLAVTPWIPLSVPLRGVLPQMAQGVMPFGSGPVTVVWRDLSLLQNESPAGISRSHVINARPNHRGNIGDLASRASRMCPPGVRKWNAVKERTMKSIARVVGLGLLVFVVPRFAIAQNDLFVGTWKANVAESAYQPGTAPGSETLRFEAVGGGIKVSLDGVNQQGPYHSEGTGKFDGVDVPVLATPPRPVTFTYAFTRIDGHTWEIVIKANGERRILVHNVVSADGNTMTSVSTAVTNQGKTMSQHVIYEKQ